MAQGQRADRVGEQIRQELGMVLAREVHDPAIGFVTLTRVKVSPDLQTARVFYTLIGDDTAKRETRKALERATPFLRRHVGSRVRLRRVPEIVFEFDASVERQERIERILIELADERKAREADGAGDRTADDPDAARRGGDGGNR
jgi:ribosome-binding factor A